MSVAVAVNNPVNSLFQVIHDKFVSGLSQQKADWLGKRPDRALALATKGSVLPTDDPDLFRVFSSADNTRIYLVNLKERTCTCPDFTNNNYVCKHRIAAYYYREASAEQVEKFQEADHPEVVKRRISHPSIANWEGYYVVYGWLEMDEGDEILVEILDTMPGTNLVYVRAFPVINDEGKLEGIFPFPSPYDDNPEVKIYSSAEVSKNRLKNVRVCQNEYQSNYTKKEI